MNPHLKKIDNKEFSLFPEKNTYMITCTNVKMNVYNEKKSYDLIADDKGVNNSWTALKDVLNFWNQMTINY